MLKQGTLARDYVYIDLDGKEVLIPQGSSIFVDVKEHIAICQGVHFEVESADYRFR